jgi:Dolichyl-phosphate-mannose-protein mannosyltransferase
MILDDQEEISVTPAIDDHTPLLIRLSLLSLSGLAVFYSLGGHVLRAWDESIYAEVAKEMLKQHSWFTPYWNHQPWFEKPPLLMWATAVLYQLFGISELSSRIVTALCGVATVWLTSELGKQLKDQWTGLVAAVVLLTNSVFVFTSRVGTLDVPLAACCTLAAYGYLRVTNGDQRWWYAVGAAIGSACMLKGAGGVVVPLAVGLAVLLDSSLPDMRCREARNSVLLTLAIIVPWHLAMLIFHGGAFLDEYLGYHVFARIKGVEGHPGPVYYYALEYWNSFIPFALIALSGVLLYLWRHKNWAIAVSFVLVITLAYSPVGTKLTGYVVPAFPFISLLAALAMRELTQVRKYFLACALVVFPLYWFVQSKDFNLIYGHAEEQFRYSVQGFPEETLAQLSRVAHAEENDPAPLPLIVCIDGVRVEQQQPLFYSNRSVVQAFVAAFPPDTGVPKRYFDPIPLDKAVDSRPVPIITWISMYPELAYSGRYNFTVIARSGPLILGRISRRRN